MNGMCDYLTPKQVAERFAVSPETVRAMCRSGRLTHIRIGIGTKKAPFRIPLSAVEALEQVNPAADFDSNDAAIEVDSDEVTAYLNSWRKTK